MRSLAATVGIVLLTIACAGPGQLERQRENAMDQWRSLVRWSEYDSLVDMIHPDWLADNPIRSIDLERLRQFRVTEYRVRRVVSEPDGQTLERQVRIRLYHVHSARERVIEHSEVWRYDEERERWFLHSGLPDPRQTS